MDHSDFLYIYTLVQDYLQHVSRKEETDFEIPPSKVAAVLRKVASALQDEVEGNLKSSLDSLQVNSVDEAGRVFGQVMENEFADGNMNWGRILTIFVFGGILAKKLREQGVPWTDKNLEQISLFVTDYIFKTKAKWIHENGGWDYGFVPKFEDKSPWLSWHNVKAKLDSIFSFFGQYY